MQKPLENENFALEHMGICLGKCRDWNNITSKWHEDLKNIDATIKQLPNYRWVKE